MAHTSAMIVTTTKAVRGFKKYGDLRRRQKEMQNQTESQLDSMAAPHAADSELNVLPSAVSHTKSPWKTFFAPMSRHSHRLLQIITPRGISSPSPSAGTASTNALISHPLEPNSITDLRSSPTIHANGQLATANINDPSSSHITIESSFSIDQTMGRAPSDSSELPLETSQVHLDNAPHPASVAHPHYHHDLPNVYISPVANEQGLLPDAQMHSSSVLTHSDDRLKIESERDTKERKKHHPSSDGASMPSSELLLLSFFSLSLSPSLFQFC